MTRGDTAQQSGGKLEGQGLTGSRRHDGQHIPPRHHRMDDVFLAWTKLIEAENGFELGVEVQLGFEVGINVRIRPPKSLQFAQDFGSESVRFHSVESAQFFEP